MVWCFEHGLGPPCVSTPHALKPSSPSGFSAHHLPNSPHAMPCLAVGPCTVGQLPACCVHCLHAVCTAYVHGLHAVPAAWACGLPAVRAAESSCLHAVRAACMLCAQPACCALPVRAAEGEWVCSLCALPL